MSTKIPHPSDDRRSIVKLRTKQGCEILAYLDNWQVRPNGVIAVVFEVASKKMYKAWLSDERKSEGFVEHPGCKVADDPNIDQVLLVLKFPYEPT